MPNAGNSESITGKITRVLVQRDTWAVLHVDCQGKKCVVVGHAINPSPGMKFEFSGHWRTNSRYGLEFVSEQSRSIICSDEILSLLESGFVDGIGPAKAKRLFERFGPGLLDIIRKDPMRLTEVSGIGTKTAQAIHHSFLENEQYIALCEFLKPEATDRQIRMFVEKYGDDAITVIKENPYDLIENFAGISFRKADRLAIRQLGFSLDDERRIAAAIEAALIASGADGHVFLLYSELEQYVTATLKNAEGLANYLDKQVLQQAIKASLKDRRIILEKSKNEDIGQMRVYARRLWAAERIVAVQLLKLMDTPSARPFRPQNILDSIENVQHEMSIQYDAQQIQAIQTALTSNVSIITGGPGTGKTTILRAIVSVYEKTYDDKVLLCAPTGRAAARMREAIDHDAGTIHLYALYGEKAKFVIVDETSMLDIEVAEMVTSLVDKGGRLLLVGDPDQLPSVGPGNVLRDLLNCKKFPSIRLNVCFRYAGAIALAANAVNNGKGVEEFQNLPQDGTFIYIPARKEEIRETALALYYQEVANKGIGEVCLLAPKRKESGPVSVTELNRTIRNTLNPATEQLHNSAPCRVGDRVMLLKNGVGKNRALANGDLGFVTNIDKEVTVCFDDGVEEPFEFETFAQRFTLAYASTIHKSQGQEYGCVILACSAADKFMLNRFLLYTAITRAKTKCFLIGEPETINYAVSCTFAARRNTTLSARIQFPPSEELEKTPENKERDK